MLRMLSFFTPDAPVVYLFHDITHSIEDVSSKFAITQQSFERFLLQKVNSGWTPLMFDEMADMITGRHFVKQKSFTISFDDANESVFTKAYPFLKKHNIPFIVFITTELIGKPNFLNADQIVKMASDDLCTIGSHAKNHVMFRYLTKEKVEEEFYNSKKILEDLTARKVSCFAFPYGRIVECSFANIRLLEKSDYDFGFSAIAGGLNQKWFTGKFFLPRVNVDESMIND